MSRITLFAPNLKYTPGAIPSPLPLPLELQIAIANMCILQENRGGKDTFFQWRKISYWNSKGIPKTLFRRIHRCGQPLPYLFDFGAQLCPVCCSHVGECVVRHVLHSAPNLCNKHLLFFFLFLFSSLHVASLKALSVPKFIPALSNILNQPCL